MGQSHLSGGRVVLPQFGHLFAQSQQFGSFGHAVGVGFEVDDGGAPVQAAPSACLTAPVMARAPPLAARASLTLPGFRPNSQDQVPLAVLARSLLVGRLDHRVLDSEEVP